MAALFADLTPNNLHLAHGTLGHLRKMTGQNGCDIILEMLPFKTSEGFYQFMTTFQRDTPEIGVLSESKLPKTFGSRITKFNRGGDPIQFTAAHPRLQRSKPSRNQRLPQPCEP